MADLWKKVLTGWNWTTWAIPMAVCFVIFAFATVIIGAIISIILGIVFVAIVAVAPFIILCFFIGFLLIMLFGGLSAVDKIKIDYEELRTKEEYPGFYQYIKSNFF